MSISDKEHERLLEKVDELLKWKEVAKGLYNILDDIDSAYDECKGDRDFFYASVDRLHGKRFNYITIDDNDELQLY
jgi:hypothetical protein